MTSEEPAARLVRRACLDPAPSPPPKSSSTPTPRTRPRAPPPPVLPPFEDLVKDVVAFGRSQQGNSTLLFEELRRFFDGGGGTFSGTERMRALHVVDELFMQSRVFRSLVCGAFLRHFVHFVAHRQNDVRVRTRAREMLQAWRANPRFGGEYGMALDMALLVLAVKPAAATTPAAAAAGAELTPSQRSEMGLVLRGLKILEGTAPQGATDPLGVVATVTAAREALARVRELLQAAVPMFRELHDDNEDNEPEWESSEEGDEDQDDVAHVDYETLVAQALRHVPDDFVVSVAVAPPSSSKSGSHSIRSHGDALLLHHLKDLRRHHAPRVKRWAALLEQAGKRHAGLSDLSEDVSHALQAGKRCLR